MFPIPIPILDKYKLKKKSFYSILEKKIQKMLNLTNFLPIYIFIEKKQKHKFKTNFNL